MRVIAATNRDPEEAVREGKLRADLFYRINVFPIQLPALQERGEDVKLLAVHFLAEIYRAAGVVKEFDPAALDALVGYHWPGNVRELRNVVERAFILAKDAITTDDLPPRAPRRCGGSLGGAPGAGRYVARRCRPEPHPRHPRALRRQQEARRGGSRHQPEDALQPPAEVQRNRRSDEGAEEV